jgi:hypothetical protein
MVRGNYSQAAQTAHKAERERQKQAWKISNFAQNSTTIKPMPLPSVAQTDGVRSLAPGSGKGKVKTMFKRVKSAMTRKKLRIAIDAPPINSDDLHVV